VKAEVALDALDKAAVLSGKRVVYPRCINGKEMVALLPNSKDEWEKSHFGTLEPVMNTAKLIEPAEIDLVLCPCSAFDSNCSRLGMGAGYYDRYLPVCKNARIAAVAFEAQRAEEVCTEIWDLKMQAVFTESATYRCGDIT